MLTWAEPCQETTFSQPCEGGKAFPGETQRDGNPSSVLSVNVDMQKIPTRAFPSQMFATGRLYLQRLAKPASLFNCVQ